MQRPYNIKFRKPPPLASGTPPLTALRAEGGKESDLQFDYFLCERHNAVAAKDAFQLKGIGPALYCKNDEFNNMAWDEIKDYVSKINKIKIYDKNSEERIFMIKAYDVSSSISNQIAVALLVDKTIDNNDIMIPSDITVIK